MRKTKQDNDMTDRTCLVYLEIRTELNCPDRSNKMRAIMKSKHDNDMTDCTSVITVEYDIELSKPIR